MSDRPCSPTGPAFSVIVTCYREERSVEEFMARLQRAMRGLGRTYEIVMVDDGSPDGTWEVLEKLYREHPEVRCVIELFRNSGQLAALTAGIARAQGEAILLIDSDLQLAPEEIPLLVAEHDRGYDVVSGYRRERRDSWLRVLPSKLANAIMRRASRSDFRDFGCTFKIFDGRLIRALDFGPRHLFSNVEIIARAGRCKEVPVTHHPRRYGKSGWTFRRLWEHNMDHLVALSERPFQLIGAISLALGGLFVLRLLATTVVDVRILGEVSAGLVLNSVVIAFLVNVGILCMIGELAIRVFARTRGLPFYVVRRERDKRLPVTPAEGSR